MFFGKKKSIKKVKLTQDELKKMNLILVKFLLDEEMINIFSNNFTCNKKVKSLNITDALYAFSEWHGNDIMKKFKIKEEEPKDLDRLDRLFDYANLEIKNFFQNPLQFLLQHKKIKISMQN